MRELELQEQLFEKERKDREAARAQQSAILGLIKSLTDKQK